MHLPPVVRLATGIRWQWKVFIPIIAVLLLSIIAIATVLRTLAIHEAQIILIVSVCFAILLCFVLLSVLLVLVERPLEDLMDTIARVRRGDLSARVAFAKRRDDISQLGRQFNEMVEQLECNRIEIEELHRREMGRAEHLATLGELAAGLAHEIRNPPAGIAGVVDVMSAGKSTSRGPTSGAGLAGRMIGRAIGGRDHTTVMHGLRNVQAKQSQSPFKAWMDDWRVQAALSDSEVEP